MNPLLAKMNYKGEPLVAVLNAPEAFGPVLAEWAAQAEVHAEFRPETRYPFALVFATTKAQIDAAVAALKTGMEGDAKVWFAYPKQSSKRHTCEFNRDTGWAGLGEIGLEGVRQVAIDEDWSALRFRRVEFVGPMKRAPERAMTAQGKVRTKGQ